MRSTRVDREWMPADPGLEQARHLNPTERIDEQDSASFEEEVRIPVGTHGEHSVRREPHRASRCERDRGGVGFTPLIEIVESNSCAHRVDEESSAVSIEVDKRCRRPDVDRLRELLARGDIDQMDASHRLDDRDTIADLIAGYSALGWERPAVCGRAMLEGVDDR
ncbi:MAG: hypothetical protein HRU13_06210 [Phycisphaerales bacterium]|nr:hypothetical protein [Phycisphaerales bacterium]